MNKQEIIEEIKEQEEEITKLKNNIDTLAEMILELQEDNGLSIGSIKQLNKVFS